MDANIVKAIGIGTFMSLGPFGIGMLWVLAAERMKRRVTRLRISFEVLGLWAAAAAVIYGLAVALLD